MEPWRSPSISQQDDGDVRPGERTMPRLPLLSEDVRQIIALNSLHDRVAASFEPLFREVVREEVQRSLARRQQNFEGQSQVQISPNIPLYQLVFKHPPETPIFSGAKIRDHNGGPLQILLQGPTGTSYPPPSPIKIELVPLDGDFPSHDNWTSEEFEDAIVKQRAGKRPLLTGDVSRITMRNGVAVIEDLQFTDNSSWIRSRHFRIGVRAEPGSYEQYSIRESMTDRFVVKDHRGGLNRKHHPPVLTDEVWRLEKIAKNGAFHIKLSDNNINNIQDLLKIWTVDPGRLRHIFVSMTEKTFMKVIDHALTCDLGEKIYCYYSKDGAIVFINSICRVVQIIKDGVSYSPKEFSKDHIQYLEREAYQQWDNLKEADEFDTNVALIQSQNLGQVGVGAEEWYPNSSEDSGIIDFKADAEEGSSSVSFQLHRVSSVEWNSDFNQIP